MSEERLDRLEKEVAELREKVASFEKIEKLLDDQERKKKLDLHKQQASFLQRDGLEKKMRALEKILPEQLELFKRSVSPDKLSEGGEKLYLIYLFSSIDATAEALKKLFHEKRKYIEEFYFPVWVDLQEVIKGSKLKLFEGGDELPITPSILIVELSGNVQTKMIGFGEIKEFLTKGGTDE